MADLPEDATWEPTIYQLEDTDPVSGGAPNLAQGDGMDNVPHQQLARRTKWLKAAVDTLNTLVVAATTVVPGIVRLSTATNSVSQTEAATPSAVKAAFDNAEARVPNTRLLATAGLATGGGTLVADRTITVPPATQAEAEAGVSSTVAMTPLRVAQLIAKRIADGAAQAGSLILNSISALATTGFLVRTGDGAVAARAITGSGGVTVTNGNGVAGNPTITLNGQAAALDVLATSGLIARTAADQVAARAITGAGLAVVTNGDGVAGNPNVSVPVASQAQAEAGTDNTTVMTPLRTDQAIAFWAFESAQQTIVGSSLLTIAHSLGYRPRDFMVVARCVTADGPYTVGDEVHLAGYVTSGLAYGIGVSANSISIEVRVSDASRLYVPNDAGSYVVMTASRWRWVARAR